MGDTDRWPALFDCVVSAVNNASGLRGREAIPMQSASKIMLVVSIALICAAVSVQAQTEKSTAVGKDTAMVNIELKDTPVKQAIDTLFQGTGKSYFILPGVTGRVIDLKLKGITFDEALKVLTDAAGLKYDLEDGVYTIGPADKIAAIAPEKVTGAGPAIKTAPENKVAAKTEEPKQTTVEPQTVAPPPQPTASPTMVVVNQAPAPVFYGHPAPPAFGYDYPPIYRFGNINIVGRGFGSPIVVAGGTTHVVGFGPIPPPPPGWVSPETMRFLRGQWAIQQRPYFITPYPY